MTDRVTLDSAALRVLAHPTRLALLGHLRRHGPATARRLAELFGIDSGAASYHLRRLASGGLIEEDTERGNKRDRWWRAKHAQSLHDPATFPGERADSRAYAQALALAAADELRRVAGAVPVLPDAWFDASVFSDHTLRLTPDGLEALKRELHAVIERHAENPEPDDVTPVSVRLQAYPLPEE
ncbi:ArsR/SmtB family transcription factor [Phytomonospora endophytica]|uniref:DNA-binding transcriptional ArsR family regulator n=1 Tax=Phytomonospora endophytica TaxID=714109 RepID=A0A841FJ14_9ACTN|nr:helix-turn-helix domain-containing protein [Phytomonospora endophytica]MBB6032639.1 DNA-binding transcriptional ArsR family regulator [Phytomonospora endophytica]